MQEDFDSRHDPDGTLDDEYFYEHYGKQPPDTGGSGGGHPLLELLWQFLVIYIIVKIVIFLLT